VKGGGEQAKIREDGRSEVSTARFPDITMHGTFTNDTSSSYQACLQSREAQGEKG